MSYSPKYNYFPYLKSDDEGYTGIRDDAPQEAKDAYEEYERLWKENEAMGYRL